MVLLDGARICQTPKDRTFTLVLLKDHTTLMVEVQMFIPIGTVRVSRYNPAYEGHQPVNLDA